jgi:hypothetical protein
VHIAQTFAESRQTLQCASARRRAQIAVSRQTFRQSNCLSQPIDNRQLPEAQLADNHVKTV